MSPQKVQAALRRIDPDLVVVRSAKTGKWVAKKPVRTLVWQHPNPSLIPLRGVHVVKEYRDILATQFALPFGLSGRSIDHARRMMFWKRNVSASEVADALDRDDIYADIVKKKDRKNYNEAFRSDYGKQFHKKVKGEPTIQAGISLK